MCIVLRPWSRLGLCGGGLGAWLGLCGAMVTRLDAWLGLCGAMVTRLDAWLWGGALGLEARFLVRASAWLREGGGSGCEKCGDCECGE